MVELNRRLILDRIEWQRTLEQRRTLAEGPKVPLRWNDLLDRIARGAILPFGARTMFVRGIHFGWNLRPSTILAALLGRPLAYLCWGVGYHRGLRRRIARLVLRAADVVLVNDARTAAEVREVAGVVALRVPYLVDTAFFAPPTSQRQPFLFCPGANDRDGDVLLALAQAGYKVVWLNYLPDLAARYAGLNENLTVVAQLSFEALRQLYRDCAAVILPLTRDVHAAGQTTTLEALACGAVVLLGAGRTAELFAEAGLVDVVEGRDTAIWSAAIETVLARERANPALAGQRAALIARDHAPEAVAARLVEALARVGGPREPFAALATNP